MIEETLPFLQPIGNKVMTRRCKATAEKLTDPISGRPATFTFEDIGAGLVLPSSKERTRAEVLAVGPRVRYLKVGDIAIVPDSKNSEPIMSVITGSGDHYEIWLDHDLEAVGREVPA